MNECYMPPCIGTALLRISSGLAVTANPHCSLATHGYRDRPGVGDLSFEY